MIVRVINVYVKQECVEDFIKATVKNCESSIQESGILRFDFLQISADPTRFILYEVYSSEESTGVHKDTTFVQITTFLFIIIL